MLRDLNPLSYDAKMAGLDFSLARANYGIDLTVYGYSDKAKELLTEIVKRLKKVNVSPQNLPLFRDTLEVTYRNAAIAPPLSQAVDAAKELLF